MLRYEWPQAHKDPGVPACQKQGNLPKLNSLLRLALRLAPRNERVWLAQGRTAWLEGRCGEAVYAWEKAVSLRTHDRIGWLLYLLATGGKGTRPDPAVAEDVAGYMYLAGDRARGQKDWENALEWYQLAFSLSPEAKGASRLEAVYLKLEQKEKAVEAWEKVAALEPESDPDHWWALGKIAELSGDWGEAAYAYGRGAALAEDPYNFLMRQGYAYGRLKAWSQAELAYRRAVDAHPNSMWPYLNVGHMRRNQKDYEGALEWYRWAEALAPKHLAPKYHIGYIYYLKQDYTTAEEYFRLTLEINPRHAWSAYWLAQCLYQMEKRNKAIEWLRSAIEWHPKHPWQWLVKLGDWLAEEGDKEKALTAYRQALEQRPRDKGIQEKIRALGETK